MAEDTQQQQQDGSKTLVSFVVGLLIGGMLVWAFSGSDEHSELEHTDEPMTEEVAQAATDNPEDSADADTDPSTEETVQTLPVGDGSITVNDQPAGSVVALERATYPIEEGWIGVRDYNNGQLSFIKGVVRFSAAGGVVPEQIALVEPTVAGNEYAIVVFSEDGNGGFNPAGDVQVDQIFATFTAQ